MKYLIGSIFLIVLYILRIAQILVIPLFITFLILQLTHVIMWSWWLVCLPLILLVPIILIQVPMLYYTGMLSKDDYE